MSRWLSLALIFSVALTGKMKSQEVTVGRKSNAASAMVEVITQRSISEHIEEEELPAASAPKKTEPTSIVEVPRAKSPAPIAAPPVEKLAAKAAPIPAPPLIRPQVLKAIPVLAEAPKAKPAPAKEGTPPMIPVTGPVETAFVKLADGFDFPVGKPDATGYYKARGYRPNGHQGEDWDGIGGGDTDLGDPIYSIGEGIVVFARDVHLGWGNVVIVRYSYRENGEVKNIDALFGHLDSMLVKRGQRVARGEKIATMGNAHGQYDAHLHFEIRKNLEIGMSRSAFRRDFSNYYDPTDFILKHRQLEKSGGKYRVAMNTFTRDASYNFDGRNFAPRARSTTQSSAALRQAVAATGR